MPNIVFAGQSGARADTPSYTSQRMINVYAEVGSERERTPMIIRHARGLKRISQPSLGETRAIYAFDGYLWVVSGGGLHRCDEVGDTLYMGDLPDGTTYITDNGSQLLISASGTGYVFKNGVLSELVDEDFPSIGSVDTIDGQGVFHHLGTQKFGVTGIYEYDSYDALDFASPEKSPDTLKRILVDHAEIWMFGAESTEIWVNTGGADFPFSRLSGGTLERGICGPQTAAKMDNTVYWVGDDRVVYRANGPGASPRRVSNDALEQKLYSIPESDLSAFIYEHGTHKFYVVRFRDAPAWCYDASTGLWSERTSGLDIGEYELPFDVACTTFLNGKWYGGCTNGALVVFDEGTHLDDGKAVVRSATSLCLENGGAYYRLSRLGLDFEVGNHDLSRNPSVLLQVSNDGRKWGPEFSRDLPLSGDYHHVCEWRTLGRYRRCHVRWRITDPVPVAFYGAQTVVLS